MSYCIAGGVGCAMMSACLRAIATVCARDELSHPPNTGRACFVLRASCIHSPCCIASRRWFADGAASSFSLAHSPSSVVRCTRRGWRVAGQAGMHPPLALVAAWDLRRRRRRLVLSHVLILSHIGLASD
ncbi:hypothetical protein B0H13DRAFT_2047700 [Mycena leptocephala]|nr:hypothetical protein B0H13DRAFT_2047700 [Mycena leptocephala]